MAVGVNNNIIMWLSKLDAIYVGFSSMEVSPGASGKMASKYYYHFLFVLPPANSL